MVFHQPRNSATNYNYNVVVYEGTVWEPHFHRNLELILVLRGGVACTVNGTEYLLSPGEYGLCLPYDIHSYRPTEDGRYFVLVFSEDFVRSFSQRIAGKEGLGFAFTPAPVVDAYVRARLVAGEEHTLFTLKSCLYAVCEEYSRAVPLAEKSKKDLRLTEKILAYIMENYRKKLTLYELSAELGYDYHYMSRYFGRTFRMSFSDLVNTYRLEGALPLLEERGRSITSIAHESGFGSVRSFNAYFLRSMGMTPTEYRRGGKEGTRPPR